MRGGWTSETTAGAVRNSGGRIMKKKNSEQSRGAAQRCVHHVTHHCVFASLNLLLPSVLMNTTEEFPYSLIPTSAHVGLSHVCLECDQRCFIPVLASRATVDALSSFKYQGGVNVSPIATNTDICVRL